VEHPRDLPGKVAYHSAWCKKKKRIGTPIDQRNIIGERKGSNLPSVGKKGEDFVNREKGRGYIRSRSRSSEKEGG